MYIIKLNFNSPLHIGEIGIGLEKCSPIIHSDTIFNAIINSYSLMHNEDETNKFLEKFEKVKISSAFPFLNGDLYFPKPRSRLNINDTLFSEYIKRIKKIDFVSQEYFEKIINYDELKKEDIETIVNVKEIYKEVQIPKVYLDRETKKSDFFFISLINFKENSGLWFTVDCENSIYNEIISCLRLLQDEGIGGKRTWGYGLFEFKEEIVKLNLPEGNLFMLLSLFYPNDDEKNLFASNKSFWDFVVRGGWTEKERKPRIKMIKEGSVFEGKPEGKILAYNKYSIYGKAYTIQIRGE